MLLLYALLLGCSSPPAPLQILAASSLTESLQAVAQDWTARGHPPVTFSFDASSRLAKQVEAGAPVDAFFSADTVWMDALEQKGLVDSGTRRNLVGNTLVVVVPKGQATDPTMQEYRRIALAGESVPAGNYGRIALKNLGIWGTVESRVVSGDSVRTVLGWVATGEADAGVVYGTDARIEPRVSVAYTLPSSSHPPIVYPMAVLRQAPHPQAAADFLAYCLSPEGMAVFRAAGFLPLDGDPSRE